MMNCISSWVVIRCGTSRPGITRNWSVPVQRLWQQSGTIVIANTWPLTQKNFISYFQRTYAWFKHRICRFPPAGVIDYENSKVYFGFLGAPYIHAENTYGVLKNGEIWASDGYTTELVFKNPTEINYGVISVYEDSANNKVIGKLGRIGKFVEINTDIWDKC